MDEIPGFFSQHFVCWSAYLGEPDRENTGGYSHALMTCHYLWIGSWTAQNGHNPLLFMAIALKGAEVSAR